MQQAIDEANAQAAQAAAEAQAQETQRQLAEEQAAAAAAQAKVDADAQAAAAAASGNVNQGGNVNANSGIAALNNVVTTGSGTVLTDSNGNPVTFGDSTVNIPGAGGSAITDTNQTKIGIPNVTITPLDGGATNGMEQTTYTYPDLSNATQINLGGQPAFVTKTGVIVDSGGNIIGSQNQNDYGAYYNGGFAPGDASAGDFTGGGGGGGGGGKYATEEAYAHGGIIDLLRNYYRG